MYWCCWELRERETRCPALYKEWLGSYIICTTFWLSLGKHFFSFLHPNLANCTSLGVSCLLLPLYYGYYFICHFQQPCSRQYIIYKETTSFVTYTWNKPVELLVQMFKIYTNILLNFFIRWYYSISYCCNEF